jgi:hypothetical protein
MSTNEDELEDDELDDAEVEEVLMEDDTIIDRAFREMEVAKRRRPPKEGEPAWRKLEQRRERQETAELISDLEDYELDDIEVEFDAATRFDASADYDIPEFEETGEQSAA